MLVWLFSGVISTSVNAKNTFRTDLLKVVAGKCGLSQQLDTIKDGEYVHLAQFRNQPVTAIVENHRVIHIGYSLFSPTQREGFGKEVCNFLERYFLELDIPTRDNVSRNQRMVEDRVKIIKGNYNLSRLREISRDSAICINLQTVNAKEYLMGWRKDSTWIFVISFPMEYDLLFGTNMDESERRLAEELQIMSFSPDSLIIDKSTKIKKAWQDNYYTLEGESYLLPNLNSNLYLKKDSAGQFSPIYDKVYPIESLANLFTSNLIKNDFTLEIKFRKYGFKTDTITIPLRMWINYCQQTGCKAFFGIISLEKDKTAVCELVMHNSVMGYNHIMKLSFPLTCFEERKGIISARLNGYVNFSRVKNLFADY